VSFFAFALRPKKPNLEEELDARLALGRSDAGGGSSFCTTGPPSAAGATCVCALGAFELAAGLGGSMPAMSDHRRMSSSLTTTLPELTFVPSASASSRRISSADFVGIGATFSFSASFPVAVDVEADADGPSTGRASNRPARFAPSVRRLPRVCTAVVVLLLFSPGPARLDVVLTAASTALLPAPCP